MTTLRTIINDAFKTSNIIAVGDSPEADEFSEALSRLQTIIKSLFGSELGENLSDISFGSTAIDSKGIRCDYQSYLTNNPIPPNIRCIFNTDSSHTVYLSPNPQDGQRVAVFDNIGNFSTSPITIKANGRRISGSSSYVANTNFFQGEWFYRADLGNWMLITDLTENDDVPFPSEFDDLLVLLLANRMNPRFGLQTDPALVPMYQRLLGKFNAKYRQSVEKSSELGLQLSPYTHHYWSSDNFDTGFVRWT